MCLEKIDYTKLFHVGIREEGQLAFIFTITGDTVSHFRDVLDDKIYSSSVGSLQFFCMAHGFRCICKIFPLEEKLEEKGIKVLENHVNHEFHKQGVLFSCEDAELLNAALQDEDFCEEYDFILDYFL